MTGRLLPFVALFTLLGGAAGLLAGAGLTDPGLVDHAAALLILRARGLLADPSVLAAGAPLPIALGLALGWLPGLAGPMLALLTSAAAAAAIATHAGQRAASALGGWRGWVAIGLILVNPVVLAGLAAGGGLLLAAVYASLLALRAAAAAPGSRAPVAASLVVAAGLLVDWRFALLLPVLLPALIAVGDPRPFTGGWPDIARHVALQWFPALVVGLLVAAASLLGSRPTVGGADGPSAWMDLAGGSLLLPLAVLAAATAASTPLLAAGLVWRVLPAPARAGARIAAAAIPVAAALATSAQALAAPSDLLMLAAAPALLLVGEPALRRPAILPLLALGLIGGAGVVALWPSASALAVAARIGHDRPTADPAQVLGLWLRDKVDVMIDPAETTPAIAARGSAGGLVMPGSEDFEAAVAQARPRRYVVVIDPRSSWPDRIDHAFPQLYAAGWPGYRLATDVGRWRVYQREAE